ncbi:MAG: HU family DNA-binding protein [Candidatus Aminicenantes bacterium]|nr:HU family DNA-binding protein [Candidatus Aminicenantes bacterium]
MNKNDLVTELLKDSDMTKTKALKFVDLMIDTIADELKRKDGKLTLVGFGTFKAITKKRKKGRNPRTGEEIIIPKRKSVKFLPGKKLKELVE